jgi:orotidine-5'-phosphate decarboxylase
MAKELAVTCARPSGRGHGHCGFVVGATYPVELAAARALAPSANFLIPGIGAQGGDLAAAVAHGQPLARGATADPGPVINAGRSVLYASAGTDFAQAARAATQALRDAINDCGTSHRPRRGRAALAFGALLYYHEQMDESLLTSSSWRPSSCSLT